MFIAPEGTLRSPVYSGPESALTITSELVSMFWWFWVDKTDSGTTEMFITNSIDVNIKYQDVGLGSAFYFAGEEAKSKVAYTFAEQFQIDVINTTISDASDFGWTTRQTLELPGYVEHMNRFGHTLLIKQETRPFINAR